MRTHLPDELLADRAAAGHLEEFEELVRRYRRPVYGICYRMAGNGEDAEDWAQECFIRVYRQLGAYNPRLPFRPWLLRVVSNACLNLAKSRALHRSRLEWDASPEHDPPAPHADPAQILLAGEEQRRVSAALERLPPLLRQAVVLRVQEELSFRELAETLGVPLQTAAARVRRALLQVRAQLGCASVEVDP